MIKFICDACKEEFKADYFYCEVTVRQLQSALNPKQKAQPQTGQNLVQHNYHFCSKCWKDIEVVYKLKD